MTLKNGGQQDLLPARERIDFEPEWFREALTYAPTVNRVALRGKHIHTRSWKPDTPAPGIVFVHGNGAHARWFDFIAPLLMPNYHMVALDFPGMGDSDWFPEYSREIMAEALIETVRQSGFDSKPVIVAHSFGGMVSVIATELYGAEIAATLICDYVTSPPEYHTEWYADRKAGIPTRQYESFEEGVDRFRLLPEQPCENEFIVNYIAKHSLRDLTAKSDILRDERQGKAEGWTWKFDNAIYDDFVVGSDLAEKFLNIQTPMAMMFGSLSHESDDRNFTKPKIIDFVRSQRPDVPFYEIPGAHHHIMLDRPHAFAAAVAAQIEQWRAAGHIAPK